MSLRMTEFTIKRAKVWQYKKRLSKTNCDSLFAVSVVTRSSNNVLIVGSDAIVRRYPQTMACCVV